MGAELGIRARRQQHLLAPPVVSSFSSLEARHICAEFIPLCLSGATRTPRLLDLACNGGIWLMAGLVEEPLWGGVVAGGEPTAVRPAAVASRYRRS